MVAAAPQAPGTKFAGEAVGFAGPPWMAAVLNLRVFTP
jgi:hypothetical protein